MTKHQEFLLCEKCGNLAGLIRDAGVPLYCCGEEMKRLVANTSDGAAEKHVPVADIDGRTVHVCVGENEHPMEDDHFIPFVYLQTCCGGQRKSIRPHETPRVEFALADGETPKAVFAYCNKHGLWKSELKKKKKTILVFHKKNKSDETLHLIAFFIIQPWHK